MILLSFGRGYKGIVYRGFFLGGGEGDIVVDIGLSHSILPYLGGMTGQSAPTVLACWSL